MIALKLAREGYGAGDPEKVLNMRSDLVIAMIQYEKFRSEYEETFYEMNRESR